MKYYHITNKNNIRSIFDNGIKCNKNGEIFLFENIGLKCNGIINGISDCIANNQIFLDEYVMFEINNKGFKTESIPDNVAEISAKWQWILKQEVIVPKYVNIFGIYTNKFNLFVKFNKLIVSLVYYYYFCVATQTEKLDSYNRSIVCIIYV